MNQVDFGSSIETLGPEECEALLAGETTGRVAFVSGQFPMILPVNYVVFDGLVVFRTDPGSKLTNIPLNPVAFEVDGRQASHAWSVVVQGHAREVTTALGNRYDTLRRSDVPLMAPGEKAHWIAIEIASISGRSFVVRERPRAQPDES